jgi:hypothetical protein
MGEKKPLLVYGAYETVETALADLDAIEQLHKDEMIGQYDAAVIDKEGGKHHVVKRTDRHASVSSLSGSGAGHCPARSSTGRLSSSPLTRRAHHGWRANHRKGTRQGADQGGQSREAHRGGHDRRNHQRAAGSAQEVTLPEQSKAVLSGGLLPGGGDSAPLP